MPATDTAIRRAIYGKLAGDTTLNNLLGVPAAGRSKAIYHNDAPSGASFPYVILAKQAGNPTYAMATTAALETTVWLVKAVDRADTADVAESVDDRLTTLLTDASLSVSGGSVLYLRRENDVDYPENTDGVNYRHVGSNWRLVHA